MDSSELWRYVLSFVPVKNVGSIASNNLWLPLYCIRSENFKCIVFPMNHCTGPLHSFLHHSDDIYRTWRPLSSLIAPLSLCCVEEDKGRRRINCLTNTSRAQSSPHSQECGAASLRVRSQVLLVTQSDKINHPAPSLWLISQKKLLCLRDPDKEAGPVFACCFAGAVAIHRHPSVESGLICHQWPLSSLQPLYSGWSTDNTETRDIIISIRQLKEIQFTFDLEKRSSTELLPYKKRWKTVQIALT